MLAGPKRETWFSAETFVALCSAARPLEGNELLPDFSCWGEQQFSTIFDRIEARIGDGEHRRKPDIVCYSPARGEDAIDTVIELKLILNDENPNACLGELKAQLLNARKLFPRARVLAMLFLAAAPLRTPGAFDKAVGELESSVSSLLPEREGFLWIAGHHCTPIFEQVDTGFHYPAMKVSLALGFLEHSLPVV